MPNGNYSSAKSVDLSTPTQYGNAADAPKALDVNQNAEYNLAVMQKAQEHEYQNVYRPINKAMIASTESRGLVDAAKANANTGFAHAAGRAKREMGRYGIQADSLQRREQDYSLNSARNLNEVDTVNRAYVDQYERNTGVRDSMINVGRHIEGSALSNTRNAATTMNQIDAQNELIEAQNDAAKSRFIGGMVGGFAQVMMMGSKGG
jgi:hypothetical protein